MPVPNHRASSSNFSGICCAFLVTFLIVGFSLFWAFQIDFQDLHSLLQKPMETLSVNAEVADEFDSFIGKFGKYY